MNTLAYIYGEELTERRDAIFTHATECGVKVFAFPTDYVHVTIQEAISISRANACIVESDYLDKHHLEPKDFPLPVVVCDLAPKHIKAGFTGIQHNRESAARKAINALTGLNLPNYAFVGYHAPYVWSETREHIFAEAIRKAGKNAYIFPAHRHRNLPDYIKSLEQWLARLPLPCGLLAVNDEIGGYVLASAERLNLEVPESLAVIGIDNDDRLCENTIPPLASIPPDFARSGHLAVDLALEMIAHPTRHPKPLEYDAGELVRRSSFRAFHTHDGAAARALEYIRAHATEHKLDTIAVAQVMGMPARTAQLRFRRYAGHTIFDEVEECRFHAACMFLRDPHIKIGELHQRCGYGCARTLRNAFFKRTGKTLSAWREKHT